MPDLGSHRSLLSARGHEATMTPCSHARSGRVAARIFGLHEDRLETNAPRVSLFPQEPLFLAVVQRTFRVASATLTTAFCPLLSSTFC